MQRFVDARIIGGVIDVDGETGLGRDPVARRPRAAQSDLFLDGRHRIDADVPVEAAVFLEQAQRLGDDERAHFVVEPARRRTIAHQRLKLALVGCDVAKADDLLGLGARIGADVDPHVLDLGLLLTAPPRPADESRCGR